METFEDGLHPIMYMSSRALNKAKSNWTITELELLAIIFSVKKCRYFLAGVHLAVYSTVITTA